MNQERQDLFYDLLAKKAVYGLDAEEQQMLDSLDNGTLDAELESLEIAASAIGLAGLHSVEPLPAQLYSKIAKNAAKSVGSPQPAQNSWPASAEHHSTGVGRSWFNWLGWAAAAAACIALAFNIWLTRFQPGYDQTVVPKIEAPPLPTVAQLREEFIRSTKDLTQANWAPGNVQDLKQVSGDVVWSDEKQAGFMRFRGLPVNDVTTTCYQLWIFDKTQDKATPIDGGIFDVTTDGEVIVPINAKLSAEDPAMFAITVERHGGVVVSDRERIAALAKVETPAA